MGKSEFVGKAFQGSAPRHGRRVTHHDVARRAGTSQTTVSLVLGRRSGGLRISDTTREAVLRAARELSYVPDLSARRLRGAAAFTPEWKYMYEAGGGRELLFSYLQTAGELHDCAAAQPDVTRDMRRVVQGFMREGAQHSRELLDGESQNGYRAPGAQAADRTWAEDSHWLRRAQYPGWVTALPEDWHPPEAKETIPLELPRTPDRLAYRWAPRRPPRGSGSD